MSVFQSIPILNRKEAQAPIAAKLAAFEKHRNNLLGTLREACEDSTDAGAFEEDKSWRDLSTIARLYFWDELGKKAALSGAERSKRLRQLEAALRRACGLTDRAMKDGLGDLLFIAYCCENHIGPPYSDVPIEKDALTRTVAEMKEMAMALAKLGMIARAAAANNKPDKAGRPALLPGGCIQGLARVYRNGTDSKPGRGTGPFADFVSEFAVAVGKSGFSRRSLIDAIQDAHRSIKPSWFDGKSHPT